MGGPSSSSAEPTRPELKQEIGAFRVQEASLVDHPAILEGFYVTKNAAAAVKKNDSGATPTTETKAADAPESAPVEQAAPAQDAPAPAAAAADSGSVAGGELKLPQAAKDAILMAVTQATDALAKIGEMVKGAGVDETAPIPPAIGEALGQVAEMLEAAEATYESAQPVAEGAVQEGTEAAPAPTASKAMVVEDKGYGNCSKRLVAKVAAVEKVGKKIKGSRLALLKQSIGMLSQLVKELDDEFEEESTEMAAAAPPKDAPPTPPPPAPPPQAPAAKAADAVSPEEIKAAVSKALEGVVDAIGQVNKSVAEQRGVMAQITAAMKAAPAPTGAGENGQTPGAKRPTGATYWGTDLAAEVAKERGPQGSAPAPQRR